MATINQLVRKPGSVNLKRAMYLALDACHKTKAYVPVCVHDYARKAELGTAKGARVRLTNGFEVTTISVVRP